MKKILFPIIFLTMLILSVCAYSVDVENDLKKSLLRLHVIADSDSDYDQNVKLAVRDEILDAVRDIPANDTGAIQKAAETAADNYLKENSISYRAHAEYGLFDFPEKQYMNITLPAGKYYGIRVVLGSGQGHNWWCVMYPPLCVKNDTACAPPEALEELHLKLNPDTYELILGNDRKVRFRLLELLH